MEHKILTYKKKRSQEILQLLRLFWPIIIGQLAQCAVSVTDTVMAGAAGTIELSGVAVGAALFNPCQPSLAGLTLAIQPMVSQLRGAGALAKISKRMWSALWICMSASLLFILLLLLLRQILFLLPSDPAMMDVASRYVFWCAASMPGVALYNVVRSYAEGLGHTRPTLMFGLIMLAVNIPLNYIFIFGKLGMPAMGGAGCGAATFATFTITALLFCLYVNRSSVYAKSRLFVKSFGITAPAVRSYLKVAVPICLSLALEVSCFSLGAMILSPFGATVVAAHSISLNISGLFFMVPLSLAAALTIRTGHCVGAKRLNDAKVVMQSGYLLTALCVILFFTVLFFGRTFFVSCYSDDQQVIHYASFLLLFCCVYMLPDCFQMASIGILRGFKDTRVIMYGTLLAYWVVALPLGYALSWGVFTRKMQASGIWIGFICGLTVAAVFYLLRVRMIFKNPSRIGLKLEN